MNDLLLQDPAPDFAELERVLKREREPRRVHLIELLIDLEVQQAIVERYMGQPWALSPTGPPAEPADEKERYLQQKIELYYRLGYDYVPIAQWTSHWLNHPPRHWRGTADTALLSRGERQWANEGRGLIASWEDYERFPWDEVQPDLSLYEIAARHLPEGMALTVSTNLFEQVLETLLGFEGLFYLLYDDPELVQQVFDRWGAKSYEFYRAVVGMDEVGAIFHADDLGFKTSTMLSPDALRQFVFPWLRKYAALAHDQGKMFWLHSCGNHYQAGTIEDLIADVGIDALHSFEDVILPVTAFVDRYGERVAALGGVDMDRLVRLGEADLRAYVRRILDRCQPGGGFALGSGNTVSNYVPLCNFGIMLDEARQWSPA
jgi:uroporphyrinogen decarboxylase